MRLLSGLVLTAGIGLGVRAPSGATLPGPVCELRADRRRLGPTDSLQIDYLISGIPFPLSAGSVRVAEEIFGNSLKVKAASGEMFRFLRTPYFSYRGYNTPDTVRAGKLVYHFRAFLHTRLYNSASWDLFTQSTRARVVDSVFARTGHWTPGSYMISADVHLKAVVLDRRRDVRIEGPPLQTILVKCRPVKVVVVR